jgi:molybdate transport system substrate-binding protein
MARVCLVGTAFRGAGLAHLFEVAHGRTRAGRTRVAIISLLLLLLPCLLAAGCAKSAEATDTSSAELRVFAASSLTSAFTELGRQYSDSHPGVEVVFNFAGSPDLVAQIQQGASADVLATADQANMDKLGDDIQSTHVFARNRLEIAVAPGNPERIKTLGDLARADLKVVLAAPEVPAGAYAAQVLSAQGVVVKPVSLEVSVKGVVTKIATGEADAGIVYTTDVSAAAGDIDGVTIPRGQNILASYPIGLVAASGHRQDAQGFVDFVLSPEGIGILRQYGFLPPAGAS